MNLKFFKPSKTLKASISKNGILTFYVDTVKELGISKATTFDFGINDVKPQDTAIYFVMYLNKEGIFKAAKCGAYIVVRVKTFLDNINAAKIIKPVVFDVTKIEYQGQPAFKMTII